MAKIEYAPRYSFEKSIQAALRAHDLAEINEVTPPHLPPITTIPEESQGAELISPTCKFYPRLPSISLSKGDSNVPIDLVHLLANRYSVRSFDENYRISAETVGKVLHLSLGDRATTESLRSHPYPSAGALYPIEVYIIALGIEGIPPGVYHYNSCEHMLSVLLEKDCSANVNEIFGNQPIARPNLIIIFSAVFHRSCTKYAGRGYRYALFEAGAAAQTFDLVCRSQGLGVVWIGGFPDEAVSNLLDLKWDIELEAPALLLAVGFEKK
jgi:SagB-type dehydrogenase family enzyme